MNYRKDIDGLRALAIFLVVLVHGFPKYFPGGFVGVDIFFVISGFLITSNILRDSIANSFTFLGFYAARSRRIFPALILVILIVWVVGYLTLLPSQFKVLGGEVVSGALFSLNVQLALEASYFDVESYAKPLLNLWSLGIEEQFYLIWPLVLILTLTLKRKKLMVIVPLVIFFVSFLINVAYVKTYPVYTFYLLPSRFWELLLGGALAIIQHNNKRVFEIKSDILKNIIVLSAILMILVATFSYNSDTLYPGWYALLPTISALLIIATDQRLIAKELILSNRASNLLGKISYPLYLWHWPLLSIAAILSGRKTPALVVLGIILFSVALAYLTWKYYELPLKKRLLEGMSDKVQLIFFVVILLSLSLLGHMTVLNQGYFSRMNLLVSEDQVRDNLGTTRWDSLGESNDQYCVNSKFTLGHRVDYCRMTDAEPTLAIIGDSHANHLVPGLESLKGDDFSKLIQVSFGGCAWFGHVVKFQKYNQVMLSDCTESNKRYFEQVLQSKTIKDVMFSYYSGNLMSKELGFWVEPTWKVDGRLSESQIVELSLSETISELERAGKNVYFIIDVPGISVSPELCLYSSLGSYFFGEGLKCNVSIEEVQGSRKEYLGVVLKIKASHPAMKIIDLPRLMCTQGVCEVIVNGELIYRDSNHLSIDGSHFVAQKIHDNFLSNNLK